MINHCGTILQDMPSYFLRMNEFQECHPLDPGSDDLYLAEETENWIEYVVPSDFYPMKTME